MSGFTIIETRIPGLRVIGRAPVAGDNRGYLERLFCAGDLQSIIAHKSIVQINHTVTHRRGTIRGLHFQHPPHAEIKVVTCLRGEIFDVAVDLRRDSPTFLKWHGEILSDANRKTSIIPEGFAHGLQTLKDDVELLYFHTAPYCRMPRAR
jgi:dTDP-4-dehydrorhamnose 3,5-epimerase